MAEAIEGITEQAFAVNCRLAPYTRDGADRLQQFRESTGTADIVVTPSDVVVRSVNAVKATAPQWAVVRNLQSLVLDATVVLREHVLSSTRHDSTSLTVFGVLVKKAHGPFVLRRESVVPDEGDYVSSFGRQ